MMILLVLLVYLGFLDYTTCCPSKWRCVCVQNVLGEVRVTCYVPNREIEMMAFELPINTTHLFIRHSSLLKFPFAIFAQLTKLQVLDLQSNSIRDLPYLIVQGKKIDLSNNPLNCNCMVYHFLNGKDNVLVGTCAQPTTMTAKPVIETRNGIQCDTEENTTYPEIVHGVNMNSTVLFIQWNKGYRHNWLGYQIGYVPYVKHDKMIVIKRNKDVYGAVISGLAAFTMYEIYVRAIRPERVAHSWSKPFFLRTDDIVPTVIPSNFKLQYLESTLFIVFWDAVDIRDIDGGLVLGCLVKLFASNDYLKSRIVEGSNNSAVLDALQADTVYSVKVAYFSSKGTGPLSLPLYIHTPKDDPCTSRPCLNGGACIVVAPTASFNCSCLPKYTGRHCQHYSSGPTDTFTCTSPVVTLLSIGHSLAQATNVFKSNAFTMAANVSTFCMSYYDTNSTWKITPIGSSSVVFEARGSTNLTSGGTLDYGRYMVNLTVCMKTFRVRNTAVGYIHVQPSSLVTNLKDDPKVVQANGRNIVLDASKSYDKETGTHRGVKFTWLCRKVDELFPGNVMDYPMVEKPVIFPVEQSALPFKRGGCYGTGPGRIPGNGPLLEFESYYVVVNTTYVFTVIVSSGYRRAIFVQEIQVAPGYTLNVGISCLKNCHTTPDPNSKMAFTFSCNEIPSICDDKLNYKWSAFYRNNSSWQEIKDFQELSETPLTSQILILQSFSFLQGKTVRLTLNVNGTRGLPPGFTEHRFVMNTGPKNGYCSANPKKGTALKTIFSFSCYDWTDPDQPITYTFSYLTSDGILHIMQKGVTSHLSVTLPPGDDYHTNHTVRVTIEIADSIGTYTTVQTPVQVTVDVGVGMQNLLKDVTTLTVGNNSTLHNLFQEGKTNDALQLSRNVLLMLKEYENQLSLDDVIKIKSSIIRLVASLKVKTMTEIGDTASIIAQATYRIGEVDPEAEKEAAKALISLTSVLEELGQVEPDYNLLQRGTEGLVEGIGNVMQMVSHNAKFKDKRSLDSPSRDDNFLNSRIKIVQNLMNATERAGDVLLSRIILGETPTILRGDTIGLLLSYEKPEALLASQLVNMGASFAFPNGSGIFGQGIKAVKSQMLVTNSTIFAWDQTSTKVSSLVVSMNIKDNSGNKIPFNNLSSPVQINLPQRSRHDDKLSSITYTLGFGRTAYHKMNVKDENMNLVINLIPKHNTTTLLLAVKFQDRPTKDDDFLFPFPQGTENSNTSGNFSHLIGTYSDAYTLHIHSTYTSKPGIYFIGIRVGLDISELKVGQTSRMTQGLQEKFLTKAEYQLETRASACLFWNREQQKWVSNGCRVSPGTTSVSVVCECYHLTSFASQLYVAPNPIDFNVVFIEFTRLHESGNVMGFVALGCIFGVYILVVSWARREDKKDQLKVGLKPLLGVSTPDSHQYQVSITTGIWRNSGTTANIYIILFGDITTSHPIHLINPSCVPFSRGNSDTFLLSFPENLGKIKKIRIWHDNSGIKPSWFLSHVTIQDEDDEVPSLFIFQQWLAVEKGAGFVDRSKKVATKKDLGNFGTSFYGKLSDQFANGHLWFSIFARVPNSSFTRVQRVTCCLSLILSIMVCNAMFYEFAPQSANNTDPSLKVGPIRLKMRQLIVGIESTLIVAPFHFFIALIFDNVSALSSTEIIGRDHLTFTRSNKDKMRRGEKRKPEIVLPRMFIFVAYFLCVIAVVTSSLFVVFYSLFWGSYITNEWLISIIMSLTLDIFIAEPVGLLVLVLIVSLLCRWRVNELRRQNIEHNKVFALGDMDLNGSDNFNASFPSADGAEFKDLLQPPEPPTRQQLKKARRLQLMNEEMYEWLFDLVVLILYMGILFAVSYGSRDQTFFATSTSVKNAFQPHEIDKFLDFWKWTEESLLPGLYDEAKSKSTELNDGYVLVGIPKITQKRVINYNCRIADQFKPILKNCTISYLPVYEETRAFLPWWTLAMSSANVTSSFQKAWTYTKSGIFYWSQVGLFRFYPSGGYIARLSASKQETKKLCRQLEHYQWIDSRTVALFVSFTMYNPYTSLFITVKIAFEMNAAGAMEITNSVDPIYFYDASTGYEIVLLSFQLTLPLFVIYYIVEQIRKMRKGLLAHFSVVFNCVEWIQIFCTVWWMVIHVNKMVHIDINSKLLAENVFQENDFELVVLLNDMENAFLAFMIFFNTLKLLLVIQFSQVKYFFGILRLSFKELVSYAVLLCVTLFSFAHFGFLVFGANIYNYSDVFKALSQLCRIIVGGKMDLEELRNTDRVLGPGFFAFYCILSMIFFANLFIMILIHYYRAQIEKFREVYGLGRFIVDRIKEACGFSKTMVPEEWTEMDEMRLQCHLAEILDLSETKRAITYKKRHSFIGYKEIKYQKVFSEYTSDEKGVFRHPSGDGQIAHQSDTYKKKLEFVSKETEKQNVIHSGAKKIKSTNNVPNSVKSAISIKLHHINSLIGSVYEGEVLDDVDTVLLGMEATLVPNEKIPESVIEIFEIKMNPQPQDPLPQSIAEIFGC